jgi:hypothetical protein
VFDLQQVIQITLNRFRDGMAVGGNEQWGPKDEKVEGALK